MFIIHSSNNINLPPFVNTVSVNEFLDVIVYGRFVRLYANAGIEVSLLF